MFDEKAIAKIEELARPQIHSVAGEEFVIDRDGGLYQIRPSLDYEDALDLYSLDALVQMIKTEAMDLHVPPVYISVHSYDRVECFLRPNAELRSIRQTLYVSDAKDVPGWDSPDILPFEEALIAIRTRFQQTADTAYLLKLLSEITNKAKITWADNGVATSIVTQQGVALQSSEQIRPIVTLRPYRTFQEIEQPASEFHIRITERGIRFIEADGGMWKLQACRTIKEHLDEHLAELIEEGKVIVML